MSSADHTTIGVIGHGDVPERLLEMLITDQASSPVGFVLCLDGAPGPMEIVAELLSGIDGPHEALVPRLGAEYPWAKTVAAAADMPAALIRRLERAPRPRLLVFWDGEPDTTRAVHAALDLGIEVRDLCDALTRLGRLPTDTTEEQDVPRKSTAPKTYTLAELKDIEDEEILFNLAEHYGIDHEQFETWDPVLPLIIEAQGGEPEDEEPAAPAKRASKRAAAPAPAEEPEDDEEEPAEGEEGEEEYSPYTRQELETLAETPAGVKQIKEICRLNNITVPGDRPRIKAYIEAILTEQEADEEEAEVEKVLSEGAADEATRIALLDPVLEAIDGLEENLTRALAQALEPYLKKLDKVAALSSKIDALTDAVSRLADEEPEPESGASPVRAAAKKAGARTVKRA